MVELDGIKAGPVVVKESSEDLLKDTVAVLQARVEGGEISDSLAVLTLNKKAEE